MPSLSRCAGASAGLLLGAGLLCLAVFSLQPHVDDEGLRHEYMAGVPVYDRAAYGIASRVGRSLRQEGEKDWILVIDDVHAKEKNGETALRVCQAAGTGKCLSSDSGIVNVRATRKELKKILKSHKDVISFAESDELIPPPSEIRSNSKVSSSRVKQADDDDDDDDDDGGRVPWGLDRINEHLPVYDGKDWRKPNGGHGVNVYVIDSGIRITHAEFEGRAKAAIKVTGNGVRVCQENDATCAADDKIGHGTHCAGTIGGRDHGVAPGVTLHAIKVDTAPGGMSSVSRILMGINWVVMRGSCDGPCVISISMGDGMKDHWEAKALRFQVERAYELGIPVIVAAGNSNENACDVQPARVSEAITVGATTIHDVRPGPKEWGYDRFGKAQGSNYGSCVDIFAPGDLITSAGHKTDHEVTVKSGTSMAVPHVTGAAALLLEAQPKLTSREISATLKVRATPGVVFDSRSADNLLLYVGNQPCRYSQYGRTTVDDQNTGGRQRKKKKLQMRTNISWLASEIATQTATAKALSMIQLPKLDACASQRRSVQGRGTSRITVRKLSMSRRPTAIHRIPLLRISRLPSRLRSRSCGVGKPS